MMKIKIAKGLPELSYVAVETEDVLCLIKRGQDGYYRTDFKVGTKDPKAFAGEMNRRLGVNEVQAEAMLNGSMCGWHVRGADPAYLESQSKKKGK